MTERLKADYRPTDASVLLAYLVKLDDFANRKMIRTATQMPSNRVNAAIAHLQRHHAIDCVVVNERELWFYATPGTDDRLKIKDLTPNGITREYAPPKRPRPRGKPRMK